MNITWKDSTCKMHVLTSIHSYLNVKNTQDSVLHTLLHNTHTFYQQKLIRLIYMEKLRKWIQLRKWTCSSIPPPSSDVPVGNIKLAITRQLIYALLQVQAESISLYFIIVADHVTLLQTDCTNRVFDISLLCLTTSYYIREYHFSQDKVTHTQLQVWIMIFMCMSMHSYISSPVELCDVPLHVATSSL